MKSGEIIRDAAIIFLSILAAVSLAGNGFVEKILTATEEQRVIGSFVAGTLFTSVFTIAPATVALGKIAQANSVFVVAFVGAFGALLGDLLIFRFVKDSLSKVILKFLKKEGWLPKRRSSKTYSLFLSGAGAIVIMSPLPDELGIALMGFSNMRMHRFAGLSYVMNFAGILLVGIIAKGIS